MTNFTKFISEVRGRIDKATPRPWTHYLGEMVICEKDKPWASPGKYDVEFMAHSRTDLEKAIAALDVACKALEKTKYPLSVIAEKDCGCEPGDDLDPVFICGWHKSTYVVEDAQSRIEEILK